jgi:hypothetical protein
MKPFLQGRKSHSASPLRPAVVTPTIPRSPIPPAAEHRHGTHVEVIKEGDKVVRLIVTCACGEKTEVDCIYAGH